MDNVKDIRIGDRLLIGDAFGMTHEASVQYACHVGKTSIVEIVFDAGGGGWVLAAPTFGPRFHRFGWRDAYGVASLVIVPCAADLDDEAEIQAVA